MSTQAPFDWNEAGNKILDWALAVIGNKIQGTKSPIGSTGTAVASPYFSISNVFVYAAAIGIGIFGAILLLRK